MFVDLNGLWVQVVVGAAIGGLVNGGFELIEQKKKGGDIDWKAVGKERTVVGAVLSLLLFSVAKLTIRESGRMVNRTEKNVP